MQHIKLLSDFPQQILLLRLWRLSVKRGPKDNKGGVTSVRYLQSEGSGEMAGVYESVRRVLRRRLAQHRSVQSEGAELTQNWGRVSAQPLRHSRHLAHQINSAGLWQFPGGSHQQHALQGQLRHRRNHRHSLPKPWVPSQILQHPLRGRLIIIRIEINEQQRRSHPRSLRRVTCGGGGSGPLAV